MIENINIKGLRGISDIEINSLGQINLFVGKNNCGKSTILESVFLLTGGTVPHNMQRINNLRNCPLRSGEDWCYNFFGVRKDRPIRISADFDSVRRVLSIEYSESIKRNINLSEAPSGINSKPPMVYKVDFDLAMENGVHYQTNMAIHDDEPNKLRQKIVSDYQGIVNAWFISPSEPYEHVEDYFAEAVENKQEAYITQVMRQIEPTINDIVVAGNRILVDVGFEKRLPIQLMGDGLKKILSVVVNMSMAKDGVLLIDEVDNGMHYSSMPVLWKAIVESAKMYNVQVFATTHNIESIESLNDVLADDSDMKDRFRSYTIRRKANGEHIANMATFAQFNHIINQELELR